MRLTKMVACWHLWKVPTFLVLLGDGSRAGLWQQQAWLLALGHVLESYLGEGTECCVRHPASPGAPALAWNENITVPLLLSTY